MVRNQQISIYTSSPLIEELLDVLNSPKFAQRLQKVIQETPESLVKKYQKLVTVVAISVIENIVINDPDDDQVLACAISANADYIISGDKDLLTIAIYQNIPIVNSNQFMQIWHNK